MNKYMLFVLLIGLLCIMACKKPCDDPTDPECPNFCVDETDPACPNYDPCWDQTEVSAAFEIEEKMFAFGGGDSTYYLITDTALENNYVRFRANQIAESYQWRIGSDPRVFTEQQIELFFKDPTELTVSLIVQRNPNLACYPEDDGVDTFQQTLVVVPHEEAAILGIYGGATTANPAETYEIEIFKRYRWEDSTVFDRISLNRIHPGCNNKMRYDVLDGNPAFRGFTFHKNGFDLDTQCFANSGTAILNEAGDSLEVRFRLYTDTEPYELLPDTFLFRGARVK